MKIAMIGHKRFGSREGGVEVVVTELARRMAALGHDVTCYDRSGRDVLTGRETEGRERMVDGVRVVPVRTVEAKGLAALSSSYFGTLAAIRSRPDVIHYHAEGPCLFLGVASRAGMRTVATIHGLDWQRSKWGGVASACIKAGERVAAKRSDELIVLSKGVESYFSETYNRRASFIPNGIDCKPFRTARHISAQWGLEQGGYVLYLGRIVPEKGLRRLIEAYKGLKTSKKLVVAGSGSDTKDYEAEVKRAAEGDPRIVFTGFVDGSALEELYSNAFAFVLPSDVEGMPMALLEAMSYGCACVTSDIPECADVLGGAGVTFPKGSSEGLGEALSLLLSDPGRARELGAAARRRIAACNDWDSVTKRTLDLYSGEVR